MSLSITTVNRWFSKMSSNQTNTTMNTKSVCANDSELGCSNSRASNEDRLNYFRSLNKKERSSMIEEKGDFDLIDKLNYKLDNYIKTIKKGKSS